MAGPAEALALPSELGPVRALLVVAPYHRRVTDLLVRGAERVLSAVGATTTSLEVPGALEIPTAVAIASRSGRFDAFVALGCVIRGETTHYDLVAGESCRGLVELGLRERLAIGNGILTVENLGQALERADPDRQDKGGHAARAALALVAIARRFADPSP
jgi:6,7-dimethyl-8-ribityllumazine synthase